MRTHESMLTKFFENFSAKMLAGIKKSITFAVAIAKNTFSKATGEVGEWLKPAATGEVGEWLKPAVC